MSPIFHWRRDAPLLAVLGVVFLILPLLPFGGWEWWRPLVFGVLQPVSAFGVSLVVGWRARSPARVWPVPAATVLFCIVSLLLLSGDLAIFGPSLLRVLVVVFVGVVIGAAYRRISHLGE